MAFGDGGWTDSGQTVIFFDVNLSPHLEWSAAPLLVRLGEDMALPPATVSDADHVGELADLALSVTVTVEHGTLLFGEKGSRSLTLVATLDHLNAILGGKVRYQAPLPPFYENTDTILMSVNDLGVAGLGGAQTHNVSMEVTLLRTNPWPALVKASISSAGVLNVFEFEGILQSMEMLAPDAPLPSQQFCTLDSVDLEMTPVYPCVVYIPGVVIVDRNRLGTDGPAIFAVNISSSSGYGIVGIRDVSGLVVQGGEFLSHHVSFSGTLAQVNLALTRFSFHSAEENVCAEFVSVQVGSVASQALCLDFVGWSKSAEPQDSAWVRTEVAGSVGFAQLVFDLGESLTVSRVDFIFEASDATDVQVDVAPATVVLNPGGTGAGFISGSVMASVVFGAEGERAVSTHLSAGNVSTGVASRHWSITTRTFSDAKRTLRIRGVAFWYWSTVLDQQVLSVQPVNDAPRFIYAGGARIEAREDEWVALGDIAVSCPCPAASLVVPDWCTAAPPAVSCRCTDASSVVPGR